MAVPEVRHSDRGGQAKGHGRPPIMIQSSTSSRGRPCSLPFTLLHYLHPPLPLTQSLPHSLPLLSSLPVLLNPSQFLNWPSLNTSTLGQAFPTPNSHLLFPFVKLPSVDTLPPLHPPLLALTLFDHVPRRSAVQSTHGPRSEIRRL